MKNCVRLQNWKQLPDLRNKQTHYNKNKKEIKETYGWWKLIMVSEETVGERKKRRKRRERRVSIKSGKCGLISEKNRKERRLLLVEGMSIKNHNNFMLNWIYWTRKLESWNKTTSWIWNKQVFDFDPCPCEGKYCWESLLTHLI